MLYLATKDIRNEAPKCTGIRLLYLEYTVPAIAGVVRDAFENSRVKIFFLRDGRNRDTGFTKKDPHRSQAVRDMVRFCDGVIVLTEGEKFTAPGTMPLNLKHSFVCVVTDSRIPQDTAESLQEGD